MLCIEDLPQKINLQLQGIDQTMRLRSGYCDPGGNKDTLYAWLLYYSPRILACAVLCLSFLFGEHLHLLCVA